MSAKRLDPSVKEALAELSSPGQPSFYLKLAETFLKVSDEFMKSLRSDSGVDAAALSRIGHTWKSNAYALGARELGDLCARLETWSAPEQSGLQELIVSIDREYQLVKAELEVDLSTDL